MVKLIKKEQIKKIQKISALDGASAYAALKQEITKAGILDRSYTYYFFLALFITCGFILSAYYIVRTPMSWQLVFWCLSLAFFSVQIGGFIHDGGHRAIMKSPKNNDFLGYLFDTLVAIGYSSWKIAHNAHHANPNVEDEDPDIELPFHSFTKERFARQKGLYKALSKFQVFLYFPVRSLVALNFRFSHLKYFKKTKKWSMWWEVMIWAIGFSIYIILPFVLFPFSKAILVFLLVNLGMGFYMSNVFAPNHKGMPQIAKGVKISFLEHQIMTTRNIYGHPLTDFVFMGLNYQIEHHLFPNCPRNKLGKITPYVKKICRKLNIEFTQVGVMESNKIILSELQQIAAGA